MEGTSTFFFMNNMKHKPTLNHGSFVRWFIRTRFTRGRLFLKCLEEIRLHILLRTCAMVDEKHHFTGRNVNCLVCYYYTNQKNAFLMAGAGSAALVVSLFMTDCNVSFWHGFFIRWFLT